jgi:hypothetical protein
MDEVISSYSDCEAVEDGILVDLGKVKEEYKFGPFKYLTNNLLVSKGYLVNDKLNEPNLFDLLVQCNKSKMAADKKKGEEDYFYSVQVEFPSGDKGRVFVAQNETGKFTIMLPEDY